MALTPQQLQRKKARDWASYNKRKLEGRLWGQLNPLKYLEMRKKADAKYLSRPEIKNRHSKLVSERNYKNRKIVLTHYSNGKLECACCGDNRYCFLTIDHILPINRKTNQWIIAAIPFYIIKNNFPKIFQVLCMNCNKLKSNKEKCPCKEIAPNQPIWRKVTT